MGYPLKTGREETSDRNIEQETKEGLKEGGRSELKVFGKEMNLVRAVRSADYHTDPHTHESEQLNYCAKGKVWIFIEDKAYLMKKGDFTRIPSNAIHWARGVEESTLITAHAPPLIGDDHSAVGLFLNEEEATAKEEGNNEYIDEYPYEKTEQEMIDEFHEQSS